MKYKTLQENEKIVMVLKLSFDESDLYMLNLNEWLFCGQFRLYVHLLFLGGYLVLCLTYTSCKGILFLRGEVVSNKGRRKFTFS